MDASAFLSGALLGLIAGGGGIFAYIQASGKIRHRTRSCAEAENLVSNAREAQNKAKEIELAAKQEQLSSRSSSSARTRAAPQKLEEHESRLTKREDMLDRKLDTLSVKEKNLDDLESEACAAREGRRRQGGAARRSVLKEQRERLLQITEHVGRAGEGNAAQAASRTSASSECRRDHPAHHRAGPGRGQGQEPADHPAGDPALRRRADRRPHRQHGDDPHATT